MNAKSACHVGCIRLEFPSGIHNCTDTGRTAGSEPVKKASSALPGSACPMVVIRVGAEQVLVEVLNDAVDSIRGQGNGIGARAESTFAPRLIGN